MKTALVLSGGGAKGSFQLGVIQHLYKNGLSPDIICGTSVGALNAVKLAESKGDPSQIIDEFGTAPVNADLIQDPGPGLLGLQNIWFSFTRNENMFRNADWVENSPDWIKDIITGAQDAVLRSVGEVLKGILGMAVGYIPHLIVRIVDFKNFVNNLTQQKSLFTLEPIRRVAEDQNGFDPNLVASSGIKLRLAVVGLESGRLKYVTEFGRLLDDPAKDSNDASAAQIDLIDGMLASAAIPAAFLPQKLDNEWCVDGGIRETIPVSAAIALGATRIYVAVAVTPLKYEGSYDNKGMLDIAKDRSIDVLLDEICANDIPDATGKNYRMLQVRPGLEVEESRLIEPGFIRINRAYGYMKSFDAIEQLSSGLRVQLGVLSDDIARKRKEICESEIGLLRLIYWMGFEIPLHVDPLEFRNLWEGIRAAKNELRGMVECRIAAAGVGSVSPVDEVPDYWWLGWEAHFPPLNKSPWDEHTFVDPGQKRGDEPQQIDIWAAESQPTPYRNCPMLPYKSSAPCGAYILAELVSKTAQHDHYLIGKLGLVRNVAGSVVVSHYGWDDLTKQSWNRIDDIPLNVLGIPYGVSDGGKNESNVSKGKTSNKKGKKPGSDTLQRSSTAASVLLLAPFPNYQLQALIHFEPHVPGGGGGSLAICERPYWGWTHPVPITVNGKPIDGLTAAPAMIQSNYGFRGNFELIVARENKLQHYARQNDDPGTPWKYCEDIPLPRRGRATGNVLAAGNNPVPVSMALIQSSFPGALIPNGSLELFVVFDNGKNTYLRHYYYDLKWHGPFPILVFGDDMLTNISAKPAVLQNIITGDFELLVIQDDQVEHYTRFNSQSNLPWRHRATVYKTHKSASTKGKGHRSGSSKGGKSPTSRPSQSSGRLRQFDEQRRSSAQEKNSLLFTTQTEPLNGRGLIPQFNSPVSVAMLQSYPDGVLRALIHTKHVTSESLQQYHYSTHDQFWHGPTELKDPDTGLPLTDIAPF